MPKGKQRWLKSKPVKIVDAKYSREHGTINDVILCQVGPAKGHGVHLDQDFIDSVVDYANENYSEKNPLKCRFGHPAMSDTTMGKQLGTFTNFRKVGEKAIADLQLLQAAKSGPNGNMWDWMFDMAEERPDFVMNSIVFRQGEYYKIIKGKKKTESDFDTPVDFDAAEGDDKKVYVEMKELLFSDIVEQGAATESLFSAQFNKEKFAVQVNEYLNENTEIDNFLKENPDKILTLLKQRGVHLQKGLIAQIKELFAGQEIDKSEFDRITLDNQQLTEKIGQLEADLLLKNTDLANADTAKIELQTQFDSLKKQLSEKNKTIADLQNLIDSVDITNFKKQSFEGDNNKPSYHKDNFKK